MTRKFGSSLRPYRFSTIVGCGQWIQRINTLQRTLPVVVQSDIGYRLCCITSTSPSSMHICYIRHMVMSHYRRSISHSSVTHWVKHWSTDSLQGVEQSVHRRLMLQNTLRNNRAPLQEVVVGSAVDAAYVVTSSGMDERITASRKDRAPRFGAQNAVNDRADRFGCAAFTTSPSVGRNTQPTDTYPLVLFFHPYIPSLRQCRLEK